MRSPDQSRDGRGPIGILAGAGAVVIDLATAIERTGRAVHIVAIAGFASPAVTRFPHTWVGLGQLGGMLQAFRLAGCRDLVIIGGVARPELTRLGFDCGAIRHAREIYRLTRGGDDGMLRVVVRFFEGQGFIVRGVADVAPALIATEGRIAGPPPTTAHGAAIDVGRAALADLAPFDIGQAVVARADGVVAFEAAEGTQRMLGRLAATAAGGAGATVGGVLVKQPKRGQELRIDLPTIGAGTIAEAKAARLDGIAVAAGMTVLAERSALLDAAEAAGLFVVGLNAEAGAVREAPGAGSALDDARFARQVCDVAARHVVPSTGAIAAVVRRGHVLVLETNALAGLRLAGRVSSLPRGWLRLPFSRAGVLHVRLDAARHAGLDVAVLAAALRMARIARLVVSSAIVGAEVFNGGADDCSGRLHEATVAALAAAAEAAGAAFGDETGR